MKSHREELIDVGGSSRFVKIEGQGSPLVLIEAGLGDSSWDWAEVSKELSRFTTVLSYDRAGYGRSEADRRPRTVENSREELKKILGKVSLEPPYVLLGHSLGGYYLLSYAETYPAEIRSVILVEPFNPILLSHRWAVSVFKSIAALVYSLRCFGSLRLLNRLLVRSPTGNPAKRRERILRMSNSKTARAMYSELMALFSSAEKPTLVSNIKELGLTLIRSRPAKVGGWYRAQVELDELSSSVTVVEIDDVGHDIHYEKPEVIIEAVRRVL